MTQTAKVEAILAQTTETVDISKLKRYPKNPRIGNIDIIAESLREHGQYRPLIVQRTTGYVLAGNHTLQAAQRLKWKQVAVNYIDVDDEQAARIVLVDNRSQDLATYNATVLADILKGLPTPAGTGYDGEAVAAILDGIKEQNEETLQGVLNPPPAMPVLSPLDPSDYQHEDNSLSSNDLPPDLTGPLGDTPVDVSQQGSEVNQPDAFQDAPDQLQGAFGLKFGEVYEKNGEWDIPPLRPDMLVTPDMVPRDLLAWAGSATKDWPNDQQWWLYNYGIDSTSGMKDISKVILSFYCFDTYFENWWNYPDRYVAKTLNSGIKMSVTPDYSQWSEDPRALSLYNMYRNRYLGRYMQEAGIKVIPNIGWRYGDRDYYDRVVRATLPKDLPVIALQLQTFDKDQTEQELKDLKAFLEHIGSTCNPELTIFYVGKQARKLLPDVKWPGEQLVIANRMEALAAQAKGRAKKTTL